VTLSARALPVAHSLTILILSGFGLRAISAQHFKEQKINDLFHTGIVSFLTIQQRYLNFGSVILVRKLPHYSQTYYNQY